MFFCERNIGLIIYGFMKNLIEVNIFIRREKLFYEK